MRRQARLGVRSIMPTLLALTSVLAIGPGVATRAQPASAIACAPASPAASPAATVPASPVAPHAAEFPAAGGQLTVFAAASLTDAFNDMKQSLEAAHPGLTITYNFAGSQALVTQLQQGAKADVFASANDVQMKAAIANGSIAGAPVVFARNVLTIIVPAANPAGIATAADLAKPGLKLVLAAPAVPAGKYAREAICKLAADSANGEGFAAKVAANVVSEEEDVRDVLAKVHLGEADAGIVYVTDAMSAGAAVRTIDIPAAANVVATYPIAATTDGDAALADAFIAY
ncbi:MAG TPA: molybdate ABC transporter substrate-binding protein, partial [Thermomicrobiales bacterium]|nr:molybdate ABC transporter substrate-binding protein [Thermomicrobiales bacterium]